MTDKFGAITNFKINYNILLVYWIKFILTRLNINLSSKEVIKYLLLFFLEQKYFFLMAKQLNKKYKIISKKNLKKSSLRSTFYSNQINNFLRYLN